MTSAVNPLPRSGGPSQWLALGGLVGPAVFVSAFVVAGLIRPGYSPVHQAVSDLGVGSDAWLVDWSIVLCSVLLIGMVLAFFQAMEGVTSEGRRWATAGLLVLSPLGFAIAGVFTEAPATLAIHWMVGAMLAYFGPVIAFTVTGIQLRRDAGWRGWGAYTVASGLATLALVLFLFWVYTPGTALAPERLGGLAERIVIVAILAWYAATGWRLYRAHSGR